MGVDGGPVVSLRRGVKQGDPLSPLLFNLVMDPLIRRLNASADGYCVDEGGARISVLAFADDLTIPSSIVGGAQRELDTVCGYFRELGMELAARKSLALRIEPSQRSWVATNPACKLTGLRSRLRPRTPQ